MTTTPEAAALWLTERRERLVGNLLAQRPAAFDEPGHLDASLGAWARNLAAGQPRNLILTGPVGTGKTWSVWHAAEVAVRCGYEGLVAIVPAAKFRRIVAPSTADPAQFERITAAGLLVLDDLGAIRLSEWDLDHLAEVADNRWSARLPTVITSNVTDIRGLLGPRISSRLAYKALVVELDGQDRRRQS
jgi:DNA replication protein DnaC